MQYVFLCGNWDFINVAVIITAVPRNRSICDIFTVIFPAGMGQIFFTVKKTISYGAGNSKFLKTEIGWISDFGRTSASQQKIILWDSGN